MIPRFCSFISVFILLTFLGTSAAWAEAASQAPKRIVVPRGASVKEVASRLEQAGLVKSKLLFTTWARLGKGQIRPGVYAIAPGSSAGAILKMLRRGPQDIRITFPEGWTARQMAEALEARGVTEAQPFLDLVMAQRREGFLFPDTYLFQAGAAPESIIDRMVQRFHQMEPKDMVARGKALGLSYRDLVTLASLVEKEARAPEERPLIAGVFLNRLKKRWRLESCATVQYALGTWKSRLYHKDLEVDSPYNTYRHYGLPPGPICNPGAASLQAAAHPAKTEAMFFFTEGGYTHEFSKYYRDHLNAKRKKKK